MKTFILFTVFLDLYLGDTRMVSAMKGSNSIFPTQSFTITGTRPSPTRLTTPRSNLLSTLSPYISSFDKIAIILARTVQLQTTSSPNDYSASITCDDPSILPYVRANVTADSTLIVSATTDCDVTIRAYTYQVLHIDSITSLSMTAYTYRGYHFRLISMGNSNIQVSNIGYDLADFTFLGNSTVTLSGSVGKFTVINRGQGTVDASNIQTPSVNATLTGSGSIRVKSTAKMSLEVTGTGNMIWCSPNVEIAVTPDPYKKKNIIYQC